MKQHESPLRIEKIRASPAQFLGGIENDLWKNLQEVVQHSLHPRRAYRPCTLPFNGRELDKEAKGASISESTGSDLRKTLIQQAKIAE